MKARYFFSLLMMYSALCSAQSRIETDRPDQTETPATVGKNYLQIENGVMYEKVNSDEENFLHPTVLWRYGVSKNFELRLQTDFTTEKNPEETIVGLAPVAVGFKTKLVKADKIIPDISLVGHLTIPHLASPKLQASLWAPDFRFLFQHKLSDQFDLSYNLGALWDGESPEATVLYTLATNYGITDKLSLFAEFYGFMHRNETADHRFDTGLTYLINDNFLVDFSTGLGLSQISSRYFFSGGLSYRIPLH